MLDISVHDLRYVDYKSGKLKYAFLGIVEKEEHGALGQQKCFAEALASLYPDSAEITSENIFSLMLEHKKKEIDAEHTVLDVMSENMELDIDSPSGFDDDEL